MRVKYSEDKDVACFDGYKFRRDKSTGYYLSSRKIGNGRKRLHVYVWEFYNGSTPEGTHVHHKTQNKYDNDIEHLELMAKSKHLSLHSEEYAVNNHSLMVENLRVNATPKAVEWHGSDEGREWHKEHYERMKDKLHAEVNKTCENCGTTYVAKNSASKYCSNKCKAAYRRKSGVDNVVKKCEKCNKEYIANKYQKTKYCELCKN